MQAIIARFKPRVVTLFRSVIPITSQIHSTEQVCTDSNVIGSDNVVRSPFPDIELSKLDLYGMISSNFPKYGNKIGLVNGISGREYSYNELDETVCKFSSGLQKMGFSKGDVMCIVSPNCPEYAVLFLGTLRAGGVVTMCNAMYTVDEIAFHFKASGAKIVTTTPAHLSLVQAAAAKVNIEKIIILDIDHPQNSSGHLISYNSIVMESSPVTNHMSSEPDNVAVIPFSSGTTGLPKGVMLTNCNISSSILQLDHPELMNLLERPHLCQMGFMPFFHIYGSMILLCSLYAGNKMVCLPNFEPTSFLSTIEKYRINVGTLVPNLILFLAQHPLVDKYDISSLNEITIGASPLPDNIMELAKRRINCGPFRQGYGLTESIAAHLMPWSLAAQFPKSVGQCIRGVKAKIMDPDTLEALPPNKEGEICLHGPNIMKGYLNNTEATRECMMAGGWLRTGDVGYYDERGMFYVSGRLKELIKVKGQQVAPAELEAVLLSHPKISDVAVIGIPNEYLGEAPKAFVVKKEEALTEKEVQEFLVGKVAKYKYLAGGVTFIKSIPKSTIGKILRHMLKK